MNGKIAEINEPAKVIDWLGKPYYSLNAYFKHVYGEKCYKIAVDAGLSCPNRDGKLDNRGCIFCSAGGSGDFAAMINGSQGRLSIKEQIELYLKRFNKKAGSKFVIYFQAYTNTYGDVFYLEKIFKAALEYSDVVGISIATRPDCLGEEVLKLLKALKEMYSEKFIWVELGLQTMHEKTAQYIRRHYRLDVYEKAVSSLSSIGIPYITHIIIGLPGESKEDMLATVRYVCNRENKPQGIKLQLLHILKNTDLEQEYQKGNVKLLTKDKYLDIVISMLEIIDSDIVIHRVTGDGPKKILVEPKWSANKKDVLNSLHKAMKERCAMQGTKCKGENYG